MMRQGPIPFFLHSVIEYVAGVAFIVAPILLDYQSGSATAISISIGVVILALAASTDGPLSMINSVPRSAHVVLDYVLAGLLIVLPFVAGFSDESAPTAFFIGLGIAHLLITIGTRFRPRSEKSSPEAGSQ